MRIIKNYYSTNPYYIFFKSIFFIKLNKNLELLYYLKRKFLCVILNNIKFKILDIINLSVYKRMRNIIRTERKDD